MNEIEAQFLDSSDSELHARIRLPRARDRYVSFLLDADNASG